MSGLILCGKQAEEPLYIENAGINIYSIEELAYYLYNNVFMVEKDFFDNKLLDFLNKQLNMKGLAGRVKYLIDKNGTFPELMHLVIKSADYYSRDELDELDDMLRLIGTKSITERLKVRADIYVKSEKLGQAIKIYKEILSMPREKGVTDSFYAKIYNNIGSIYAKRMEYAEASKYFRKAYEMYPTTEVIKNIVSLDFIWKNEKELVNDTVKYGVTDEMLEIIADEVNKVRDGILESDEYKAVCETLTYDGKCNLEDFYEGIQEIVDEWKEAYREEMV
ncbi:MAG: tetratricopeptide repeat protein [Lachnospiraceae bacterium]|nr:tetratricopeptide repeat protein [Lachnospiraceae bacterium]